MITLLSCIMTVVPVDKALSRLHTTASVRIETVEESIQEEMQKEVESAVTDTIAGQRPENDFDEKKEVLKAFDQHEEKGNTCVENEKAEIQHEVQNQEFIVIKHLSLEGKTVEEETAVIDNNSNQPENELEQTADIVEAIDKPQTMVKVSEENEQHANHQSEASCIECITIKHIDAEGTLTTDSSTKPSSNVGKQEKIPESQSVENSGIKDGDKITPEEATDIKEATSVEIQKFNIKSVPEDKALSNLYTTTSVGVQIVEESIQEIRTEKEISEVEAQSEFPTSEIVKGETIEEILQQQTLQEEESATTTNNHKHRRPVNELEKTANIFEHMLKQEIDRPEHVTKVSIANEEWEDHQSEACMESMITKHTNSEGKVGSESRIKSSYDVDELEQIPKSQLVKNSGTLKGVPEDKAPQTLSNAAFVSVEVVDGSNQDKTHMEAESAATGTKEGQKPENDFEMEETEAFGLHELTCQTSTANEMKAESQSKPQNQDTPFAKHPDFEGETTETISTSSIEEHDKVPVSHNGEKLDIKDNEKFIEVEAREMEEAAKMKLLKIETESATEDEGQSIMLTLANVKGETEEILCQQTLQEEESAVIDNDKRCRQENELPNMADVEATGQPKTVVKVCAKNEEHADCRSEASNEERVIKKHTKAEGKVTSESSTESSYSMNVLEKTEESNTIKISDIMEGVIEDKALQTLPNSTSILTETVDQSKQEETHTEVELAVIDTKEGQIPENDFEEKVKVPEVFDLHEVTCQTRVENELKVEPQSEAQNQDTTFIKYVNLEGETTEITPTKVSEEQEKVPVSSSAGKLEINNDGRFIQEEAEEMEEANEMQLLKTASEGMSEDKAQQTLPTTAYVSAEASDKSIQEEIHIKEELEVSTTKEGQIPEIDFDDKRKIPKAFGLHDVTHQTHAENVLKAEPQSEVQDQEPIIITYSNLEGETIEINPINDTEKQEKVPASHKGEILEIEDDGKFIQEEAKEMEEETKMQPQKTATESLPEDDIQSTMTTSAIVKGDPKEPLQQQALHNDETAVVDNDKSCRKENELEKMADVVEVDAEIEDQADQQSEESRIQSVIIKHINAEGIVTSESSTKSSYEADEQKIVDSHLVEDLESTCGSKITAKEATDTKQLTGVEIQKSETAKSLPDNEVLQTLPNTASLGIEVIDESSQEEIHTEVEVAVTDIIEGQTPEKDFEDKNNTPETFDLHEVACQPNAEKELKAEPKTEVQNQETTFINHQILEEETTEINPTKDTKEKEKVPASHTKGKLDIEEDDGKFKQEEAKQTHEATEMQLLKTATENRILSEWLTKTTLASFALVIPKKHLICVMAGLPEDEVQSTLLTFAIVKSDIKQILHQQALQDDESAAFDNKKSCRQENELEKMSNVEAIDQPEIMTMVGGENEEHADCPSEASSMQRLITNDIKIEGIVTSESRTKSSYDADKLENKVNSHSGQNYECKDGNTTTSEEAIDTKQSTDLEIQKSETESLAEDKAPQTLPNTAFVDIEAVGENIQGKEHIEAELTMAKTIEGQLLENHFQGTMNIPKAFGLHEVPCQPNAENELKVEPISEVQNHITCIKPLNLEGETTETNLTINTEEQEKFTESHNRDKSEIEDDGKFKLEEAKQIKEETEMQLLKTVVESVPQDKDLQTSPNTAFVSIETVEESIQEELPEEEEELIVTDPKEGQIPENDFEVKKNTPEALDLLRGTSQPTAGNELKIEPQSEVQNQEVTFIKHLNLEGDTEEINPTNDTGAQEKDPGSHSREKFKIEEDGKFMREGAKGMEETTDMQLLKTTEMTGLPENELQSTLPTSAIIQHDDKQILQQQTIQDDKSIVIDSDKSCRQESELEKISNVEAFDQTETMAKVGIIKEEQADYQSEASSTLQSVITKYNNAEGIIKSETSTKSSYDADEQAKIVESHSVENLESKDESKITAQEATDTKQLTDVKIQKSETESVHEDKSLQTLLTLVGNEAAEETSQEEIYTKMGSAVSCSKEGQTPENDFEANKDIPKVYGIQEVTCQCNEENEPKAESLSEGQNWETTSIKHLNADGENMEIAPTHDTKKQEKVAVSHTKERSWIEDDGKFIQEEAIKTATEKVHCYSNPLKRSILVEK
ncbi:hypothetical protein VNO77_20246 [Canavalia gladiata]|uniref:Uncharacterized protein n=1 Tax=Canavalia gladiata TaxID=3824 RepID=A0AAN9LP63_CANGL